MVWSKKRTASSRYRSRAGDGDATDLDARTDGRESAASLRETLQGGTVTRVAFQQRRGSDRLNVYVDDAFAFSLAASVTSSIKSGDSLDGDEIRALLTRDASERAYDRALAFLDHRPRSRAEVRRRLAQAGFDASAIGAALERLEERGLIDDMLFAQFWVDQRLAFRPRGPRGLRAELRAKGVDADTTSRAIAPAVDQQEDVAYRVAAKLAGRVVASSERELGEKLTGVLLRRGFEFGAIRAVVHRLWGERAGDAVSL